MDRTPLTTTAAPCVVKPSGKAGNGDR
jgi:hypothetical protein